MAEVSVLTKNKAKNIDSQAKLPGAQHGFHLLLKTYLTRSTVPCGHQAHGIARQTLLWCGLLGPWDISRAKSCCAGVSEGVARWIWIFASVQISSAATLHQAPWAAARR